MRQRKKENDETHYDHHHDDTFDYVPANTGGTATRRDHRRVRSIVGLDLGKCRIEYASGGLKYELEVRLDEVRFYKNKEAVK